MSMFAFYLFRPVYQRRLEPASIQDLRESEMESVQVLQRVRGSEPESASRSETASIQGFRESEPESILELQLDRGSEPAPARM